MTPVLPKISMASPEHDERSRVVLEWPADAATIDSNPATDVFVNAYHFQDDDVRQLARMPQLATLELNGLRVSAAPLAGSGSLRALGLTNPSPSMGSRRCTNSSR